jgi:hypothetical protein
MEKKPILKGFVSFQHGKASLNVWCPFCCGFHIHGWDFAIKNTHLEHRAAHCSNDSSPLYKTGYWIGSFQDKEIRGKRERTKKRVKVTCSSQVNIQ